MNQLQASNERNTPVEMENNGLLYGSLSGLLVGVIISGPYFTHWPIGEVFLVCALSSFVTAVLCHCMVAAGRGGRGSVQPGQPGNSVDVVNALQDMDWNDD